MKAKQLFWSMLISASAFGCAFVDYFTPRQYALNLNSEEALNQETLLNIVRASQYRPMTFMAVSQLTGSQMENFNIGLATITFGPGKSAAAKEFIFGPNTLQRLMLVLPVRATCCK